MTSHHYQAFIRIVLLSHLSASCEAVSLARLVKAEIVSPYSGILINTGVDNPTVPLIMALGDKRVLLGWWGHVVASTHIRGQGSTFSPTPSSSFAYPFSCTRAPAPKSALPTSTFSSQVRSRRQVDGLLRYGGTHKKLRKAGYLSNDIA